MPNFKWDEIKGRINLEKHGISFLAAQELFDGRPVMTRPLRFSAEDRYATNGELGSVFYTVIWMWRREAIRLISTRRASREERRRYRQLHD